MEVEPRPIELLDQLPKPSTADYREQLASARNKALDTIIVLDDDPTGTQTVHDIPVLTEWSVEAIQNEFELGTPLFYILTNSRSLNQKQAVALATKIGHNIITAANRTPTRFWVISRSDSTLRGHYPAEVTALQQALQLENGVHFIIPAFFEGGRYTVNDIHYVQTGDQLIPASATPYAQDPVFGFKNSDLKKWVSEKTNGEVTPDQVSSLSIKELRTLSPEQLSQKLADIKSGGYCVVNAASYQDLVAFNLALLHSEIVPVFRTAASQVAALACLPPKSLLTGGEIATNNGAGGLIVAGSFVSTTTDQLNHLFTHRPDLIPLELSVAELLEARSEAYVEKLAKQLNQNLIAGNTAILFTSRKLITDASQEKNLLIGQRVSKAITDIVKSLESSPRFLITKGGITSSDVSTEAMGVKRALVKGQVIKGVPVWQLGKESKFPGLHQIIFPGNVGHEGSLTEVVNLLSQ